MKKLSPAFTLLLFTVLLSGCTHTFMGSVFVFTFRDIVLYVMMAFILAILISFKASGKQKRLFWIWFILSLLLTPLSGFIYLLILYTNKED
jgi:uncharacterized membrane protein